MPAITTYLFDWGDTLMIDFAGVPGKMCDWAHVEAVDGAAALLARLSQHARIYIATGAADSRPEEIQRAFERVGLDHYLSGYFCKANLGLEKGSPQFYQAILAQLETQPEHAAMVGDSLEKDILPAAAAGLRTIWFNRTAKPAHPTPSQIISSLDEWR